MSYVPEQRTPSPPAVDLAWFAEHVTDRTARGIAVSTEALIQAGRIAVGTQLPTVRDLAHCLGVSPATVSAAWRELRRYQVVSGQGRNGLWVCGNKVTPSPLRFGSIGNYGDGAIDLSLATPDPALLPCIIEALASATHAAGLNRYDRVPILDVLETAMQARWPYPAEAFLATNGGFDAVYATMQTLVRRGMLVAVEDPTGSRLLDIIDNVGARPIPVACDDEGPDPASLAAALRRAPAMFLYQPRTHSVTGRGVSADRLRALARVLRASETLIVESDGIGDLSAGPCQSLGMIFPGRTIHIHSVSKSLGPDLRVAVLSGPRAIVDQIQAYRSFSVGWTSRILQSAAAWLSRDAHTGQTVTVAKQIYAARRRALIAALHTNGVAAPDHDGLCLWVPVRSEQFAMVTMAARGIIVMPGRKHMIEPSEHIRVATSMLTDAVDLVAASIALACSNHQQAVARAPQKAD